MANLTPVTSDSILDAVKSILRSSLPTEGTLAVLTVDAYERQEEKFPKPAVFFEITGIDPVDGDGSGNGARQFWADISLSAYIVVAFNDSNAKRKVVSLTAAVAQVIWMNKWGINLSEAEITTMTPDRFAVEPGGLGGGVMQAFETWRIDWHQHGLFFALTAWPFDSVPGSAYVSTAPKTGVAHEADYEKVSDE